MSGPLDLRLIERGRARRSGSCAESGSSSEGCFCGVAYIVSVMFPMGVMGRASDGVGLVMSVIARELLGGISRMLSLRLAWGVHSLFSLSEVSYCRC